MGSLDHDGLLTLAQKAHAAAGDADTTYLVQELDILVHALVHHLDHERPALTRLPPAEARLLRRGQERVSAAAQALLLDAADGCTGRGARCPTRVEELVALLTLQARDERRIFHGATHSAVPGRWSR